MGVTLAAAALAVALAWLTVRVIASLHERLDLDLKAVGRCLRLF
jgi:hypothetical protein